MILANWRGFSGGTSDMYDEVLKFGAKIVDELTKYDMPVFVYIPPKAELRGGAWVVVDPTINRTSWRCTPDPESRRRHLGAAGHLRGSSSVRPDQKKVMARTDAELAKLLAQPASAERDAAVAAREAKMAPLYQQVAIEFADLHDRAGRMKAKGVIRDVVSWEGARGYFYKRLGGSRSMLWRRASRAVEGRSRTRRGRRSATVTGRTTMRCYALDAHARGMVDEAEKGALVQKLKGIFAGILGGVTTTPCSRTIDVRTRGSGEGFLMVDEAETPSGDGFRRRAHHYRPS